MDVEESHDEFVGENMSDPEELFDDEDEDENVDSLQYENGTSDNNDINDKKKKESEPKPVRRKSVRNPRVVLNFDRLRSENGIPALIKIFEKFKFRGKRHEKEDLIAIMQNMQHWMCNILYPGYDMETCMKALEKLGKKRVFQTYMKRERTEAKTGVSDTKEDSTNTNVDVPDVPSFDELLNDDFNDIIEDNL